MIDRTDEWTAAKRQQAKPFVEPRNEREETMEECAKRLIREHGIDAEKEANRLVMYNEGFNHTVPRNVHLIAFYRVVARLVRIDA